MISLIVAFLVPNSVRVVSGEEKDGKDSVLDPSAVSPWTGVPDFRSGP